MKKQLFSLALFLASLNNLYSQIGISSTINDRSIEPYFFGFNGANTVRADSGWSEQPIKESLQYMLPGNMRYPAGTISNFWDWMNGWFLKAPPYNIKVPFDNSLLASPKPTKISDYAKSIGGKGPQMVYNLNLMTSNLNYQMGGAAYATSLGLSIAGLEYGNEFYNGFTSNPEHTVPFPNPKAYADTCKRWASVMNTWFPGKRVSVVGVDDAGKPADADYTRKLNWLNGLLPNLNSDIDAVTLHLYTGAGAGEDSLDCSNTVKKMMVQPFKNRDSLEVVFEQIESYNKKIWVTEFNIAGAESKVFGTWAHGLFVASQALTYIERPSFELVDCHDMFGDALSSAYFKDTNGFQDTSISSTPNELTALGSTLTMVSKTLQKSKDSQKIVFSNVPAALKYNSGGGRIDTLLYGFAFNQASTVGRKQMLLMNLSNNTVTLDLDNFNSKLGGVSATIDFEMLQGDPTSYIIGNAETVALTEVETCGSVTRNDSIPPHSRPNRYVGTKLATDTIKLKPYSIMYLGGSYGNPVINIDKSPVCGNNAQTVICYGKAPLTLVDLNGFATIEQISENTFKVQYTGNSFPVTANLKLTQTGGQFTNQSLNFIAKPVVTIDGARTQSICNFPFTMGSTASGGNSWKYIWSPNEGITNPLIQDVVLNQTERLKDYIVQTFNGSCWSNPDTVTIKRLAYADAGLDKNICTSTSTTLASIDAPTSATYEWKNLTTNIPISTNQSFTFTTGATPSVTNYQFKVTEGACVKTDQVKVTTAACCSGGTFVLNPGDSISIWLSYLLNNSPLLLDTIYEEGETIIVVQTSSNTIQFNGDVRINKNIKIVGHPNLKFAENAKIIIDNDRYLILESCTLDVCTTGKFADGIYANSCQANLRVNNCTIKRFKSALNGIYNAPLTAGNTNFIDNIIGASIVNYSADYPFLKVPFGNDTIEGIYNNNFYAPNIITTQNTRGLFLDKNEKIILSDVSSNLFKNLDVGIYNNGKSGLKISNSTFSGSAPVLDTAIYANNPVTSSPDGLCPTCKKIEVGSASAPNSFSYINNGIIATGTGVLNVHHNSFSDVTKYCAYFNLSQDSILFNDNLVNTFDKLLYIVNPSLNTRLIEIKNDSVFTAAVDDSQPTFTKTAYSITSINANNRPVSIIDNYIRCRVGIYASKMNAINCEYNLIEIPRTYTGNLGYESYGIRLENCSAPKLYINTVRRHGSTTWVNRLTGFSLNACSNADMQCNKLEYLRRPVYMAGSCIGQKFYNDTINSSGGGLVFSSASISAFGGNTAANPSTGNVFSNFLAATLRAEGTLSNITNYYFRIGNDPLYRPVPQSVGVNFAPQTATQIRTACAQAPPKSNDEELLAIAAIVEEVNDSIADTGNAFDFSAELNYYAQQSLYNQIITENIDYTEHSDAAELVGEFVSNVSETAIGLENEVVQMLSEGNIEGAMAVAAILPDSSIFEKNIQYVTQIILEIDSDTLYQISHRDSVDLTTLAYTHSLIGGPAVFTARNLLQLVVEEFLDGTTKSLKGEHHLVSASLQNLYLTPNPATEKASVVGLCDEQLNYKVELYNLQNQLVLTKITGCQSNFAINTLSNGIYLYKIFNNTNLVGYGKIQVLK